MRQIIGYISCTIGVITFAIAGLWGMYLNFMILIEVTGFWGFVIGLTVLPLTFVAVPWYAGLAMDYWLPLLLNYGGGIVAVIFWSIGFSMFEE